MAGLIPFNRKNSSFPSADFDNFQNMLDDFFGDRWLSSRSLMRDTFKIDVKENDRAYTVEAELPGVKKEDVSLDVQGGRLSISIKHEESVNEQEDTYIHRERRFSSMSRSVHLENADMDKITAKLEHGVLSIDIPKRESDKTHKIDIM